MTKRQKSPELAVAQMCAGNALRALSGLVQPFGAFDQPVMLREVGEPEYQVILNALGNLTRAAEAARKVARGGS